MLKSLLFAAGLAGLAFSALAESQSPSNIQLRPAIFKVTPDIVNAGLQPFAFTSGSFGNTLRLKGKGGFEPGVLRTKIIAMDQDSPDRIYNIAAITQFDGYSSGYLDGADVRVFRVENGQLKLVRTDKVAQGGCVIEGWQGLDTPKVIAPATTSAQSSWAPWSRPDTSRWFSVIAIDKAGNKSEPATPVKLGRVAPSKGLKAETNMKVFRGRGDDTVPPPAPTNFRASVNDKGLVELSWDPVEDDDLAGYRVIYSDTDPAANRGIYLQLSESPEDREKWIKKGDMVFVGKSLIDFDPSWLSPRLANLDRIIKDKYPDGVPEDLLMPQDRMPGTSWRLAKHEAGTPVANPGEYYFEMTIPEGGTEMVGKSGNADLGSTDQDFYAVPEDGKEYIMEVWMKADRNDRAPVVFTWDGDERVGGFLGQHPIQVGTEWKRYEVRFTGQSADKGNQAYLVLKAMGPGTYSFDNFRVYRADADFLGFLPYQKKQLEESGMKALRTHGPIKTGVSTYSMRQFLGGPGEAEGVKKGSTLPQILNAIKSVGMEPWLQIEFHMSDDEWLAFAEYMAAPYDPATDTPETKPYASLRYQQGHPAPWVDDFDRIYFELSNETWNGLFFPWTFSNMPDSVTGEEMDRGTVYGLFNDRVIGILRSSPYWSDGVDKKFQYVLGGWANGDYSEKAVKASKEADYITVAAYNGGWDEGEGPPKTDPASYFNVLAQVNQVAIPRARDYLSLREELRGQGRDVRTGTYEAGPGYVLNGLNKASVSKEDAEQQEQVMKSKLAGTATIDSFLARAYYGFDLQNFFTYSEGRYWTSYAKQYRGGQPHACFLPLEMFNRYATGDMLKTVTISVPTVDTPKLKRREAVENQPLAAVYATRKEDRVSVFCISRRIPDYPKKGDSGDTRFELQLPFTKAKSITLYRMSGSATDTNIDEEKVKIEKVPVALTALGSDGKFVIDGATGGTAKGLPPSETFLYVFDGTDIPIGKQVPPKEVLDQPTSFTASAPE